MDCPRGSAVAGLYDDILVEILSRVPVKDLRRSKCVSKPWRDLISDPLHRKKLPQTLEGFFHGGRRSFGHFTCLTGTGESVPPVDLDPSFSFLTEKLPGVERLVLLDSCNGLLLFGCNREDRFGYIVCNPATEECVDVPASSCSCPPPPPFGESNDVYNGERYAHTFLIFDPAASVHFHLVQFWNDVSMEEIEAVHSYSSETRHGVTGQVSGSEEKRAVMGTVGSSHTEIHVWQGFYQWSAVFYRLPCPEIGGPDTCSGWGRESM